jgi:hypothetical protein
MRGSHDSGVTVTGITGLALMFCLVAVAFQAWPQEGPGAAATPTVYRDGWKVTVDGKPQADGTFTMVFRPHNGEPVEFTVTVAAKMKPKQISQDLWKELSLAAGVNYRVKQKGNNVVTIGKVNRRVPGIALEITEQKLSGTSLTISAN